MANDPYCGNCHNWMTEMFPNVWVCNCTLSGHAADTSSKDPNCHNSTHDHYDPHSPIVLSQKAEREAEESTPIGVYDLDHFVATGEYIPPKGFVAGDGPTDRPGSLFADHPYHVAVFDNGTGEMLGWRPLREPKIDEETRAALDAILREANEKAEEE